MYSLEEIIARSYSENEIVLNYTDAMDLLYWFGVNKTKIYGWEGWILHPSGKLGHWHVIKVLLTWKRYQLTQQ